MLLEGKRILVTGVLSETSIAFSVARLAQEQGAEVLLTSFGRAMRLTQRSARRLAVEPDVVELDITDPAHLEALTGDLRDRWGRVDGVLHAVAFAPSVCLGGDFLKAGWDDVATTLQVSAYSLKALATAVLPLMEFGGGSIVALDFDARQAWPAYDWMGVAKAALESTARYLARDLGRHHIRVNLVAAGPLRTVAAKGIAGFDQIEDTWGGRAPLGWDTRDAMPVARACVAMLSDWFPATTGEMVHVDGGFHAVAAPVARDLPPASPG
ncbi:MAG TPA: enoyl-ACP reductase FabI [Acidimicrobiales bacterium]|jgi:enoyl-[acyl-carrier protein] reductase I|nr:enoyl-ACP reductase FabI [Acidimicrobiales bacterium]